MKVALYTPYAIADKFLPWDKDSYLAILTLFLWRHQIFLFSQDLQRPSQILDYDTKSRQVEDNLSLRFCLPAMTSTGIPNKLRMHHTDIQMTFQRN